jgi:GAF domain-containing protein
MHPRFRAAEEALRSASGDTSSICEPLRVAFDVDSAGVSTLGKPFGARLVCAAGKHATVFGELQIDLGEGPAWDAYHSGRPVLVRQMSAGDRWPILAERMDGLAIEAVFAFPLRSGALDVGALCLTTSTPGGLNEQQLVAAAALVPLAGAAVVARAMRAAERGDDLEDVTMREVHQATGMAAAQLGVAPDDALLAIRAHAFATGRSVRQVAQDLVERRLDLSRDDPAT